MNLPFYIAKRYLIAKKSQNAINIISWISVVSISIGTLALVVVLSAFNGLESLVESLFESFDSDITIEAKEGKVFNSDELDIDAISSLPEVADYTKVLEEICGVRYKKQQAIVTLKGVEDSFLKMSQLDSSMVDGSAVLRSEGVNYAISGYSIASQLGLYLEKSPENLSVYAPKRGKVSSVNPMNSVYRRLISPAGVFYISPEFDTKYIIVPLHFVQDLLDYSTEISALEVSLKDEKETEEVVKKIQQIVGNKFSVKSRYELNALVYKTNKSEKWVTSLVLVFILIIAAFNILSSISMLIIDKKKDIATLTSLGASKRLIRRIFFMEGILINLLGAFSGLILGILICLAQQYIGLLKINGGIVEYYPVEIDPLEMVYILITVIIIGFLTSWYPVRNLTKVN